VAGLSPDQLGSLSALSDPLAVLGGGVGPPRGGKGKGRKGRGREKEGGPSYYISKDATRANAQTYGTSKIHVNPVSVIGKRACTSSMLRLYLTSLF